MWMSPDGVTVINLPTKRHWKDVSRLEDVEMWLVALRERLSVYGEDVLVCVPALGCGLGGLQWAEVRPLMEEHLADLHARVLAFAP